METERLERKFRLNMASIERRGESDAVITDIMEQLVKPWSKALEEIGYSVLWSTLDIGFQQNLDRPDIFHVFVSIDANKECRTENKALDETPTN